MQVVEPSLYSFHNAENEISGDHLLHVALLSIPPQSDGSGRAGRQGDPVFYATWAEACLPPLFGGGRRAMPPPSDGCQGDPGPS